MGCGASHRSESGSALNHDLKLVSCKLTFDRRQLNRINRKFNQFLSTKNDPVQERGKKANYLNVVVERLIQRLICNVGIFDSRFSSAFLINLEPLKNYNLGPKKNFIFKYMVRLDLISTPALYPEFFKPPVKVMEGTENESLPEGFAKIKVHGEFLEKWMGLISSNGFLRRDKIQERFIELLARAAAKPTEPLAPGEVDESRYCGSPGKIVDPITLHYILRTPAKKRFFFGSADCNESRFPDPRDFRIAIVEGVPEIRLHISFLSPAAQSLYLADDIEVSIVLGVGVAGWPSSTDFPFRLPLNHVDVILGYQAAQMNYYLVPKSPHVTVCCEDRLCTWEIRALAPEMFMLHHYSPTSVIFRVYKILVHLLNVLKARGVKSINKYILKNCLFYELEVQKDLEQWAPRLASQRVLSILDRLLICLRCQNFPSYIFGRKNLLLQDDLFEEDLISDGDILENYLKLLHADENHFDEDEKDFPDSSKDLMENMMLWKWKNVITSMLPPMSTRSSRLSLMRKSPTSTSYTCHQIDYIALLLRQILNINKIQKSEQKINDYDKSLKTSDQHSGNETANKEDFIHLLEIIFDQAKRRLFSSFLIRSNKKNKKIKSLRLDQIIMSYDISISMLIDDIRRKEDVDFRFTDDTSIVIKVMEYLYKAMDSDGKVLGLVLRPYLNQMFQGSHENCWFLPEWKKNNIVTEIQAMEAFGHLVLSGKIDPLMGIMNAATKNWNWAIATLQILRFIMEETSTRIIVGKKINSEDSGLKLIFTPEPGKTIRINVTPMNGKNGFLQSANEFTVATDRQLTVKSFQEILGSTTTSENFTKKKSSPPSSTNGKFFIEKQAPHILLRDGNPFTVASMEIRRQGNHRGLGSIVQALISLHKLTVLQEISQYLPDKEKKRVLADIKKLSKEIERLTIEKRRTHFSRAETKKNRFSFRKSSGSLTPKKISSNSKEKMETGKKTKREIYRNINDFGSAESFSSKTNPENIKAIREENEEKTLLDACRLMRQWHNTNPPVNQVILSTFPKFKRTERKTPYIVPESTINAPFYIRVSTLDSKTQEEGTSYL